MFNPYPHIKPKIVFINRLYIPLRFNAISNAYITKLRDVYRTEVLSMDLQNPKNVENLNAELLEITDGKIRNAVSTGTDKHFEKFYNGFKDLF